MVAMTRAMVTSNTECGDTSPTASMGERAEIQSEMAIIAASPLPIT